MQIQVGDISIHCEVSGRHDAPAVLCLHSLATDIHVWERQLDALEQQFRVVRADLRGHGGTTATSPPYTLDLLRRDAVALLDALSIERASVLGVSIGAIIALGLALDNPDRVERIVVADCRADAPGAYVSMWDGAIAKVTSEGLDPVIDDSMARWFTQPFREAHPELLDEVRQRALRTSLDGFVGCARAVQGLAYLPRLHEIAAPALFVVGSADPAAPPAVMKDMADRVDGASYVELDGAGHLTPIEAGEDFTEPVVRFLADV